MTKATLFRTATIAALFVMMSGTQPAQTSEPVAQMTTQTITVSGDAATRFLPLGVGKTAIIDLPRDVKDVLVGDPKYANAVIRTARRAYVIGVAVGQTNIFFFDAEGRQIAGFDIAVTRDLNGIVAP